MRKFSLLLFMVFSSIYRMFAGGDPTSWPYLESGRSSVFVSYYFDTKSELANGERILPLTWLDNGLFAYVKIRYKNSALYFAEVSYSTVVLDIRNDKKIWASGWTDYVEVSPQGDERSYFKGQWKSVLPLLEKFNNKNSDDSKVAVSLTTRVNGRIVPAFIRSENIYFVDKRWESALHIVEKPAFNITYKRGMKKGLLDIYIRNNNSNKERFLLTVSDSPLSSDDSLKPVSGYFYNHYEDSYVLLVGNYENDFFQVKIKPMISSTYLTPTVNRLRFRATPTLDGRFIRHLNAGERLELIEKGKTETIGDAKGTWVKVKTTQGEVGWCFDAYLKELK